MSGALDAQMVRELVTSISGLTQALQTSARGAERVADTNTALERGARDRSHSAAAGAGGLGGMVGDLAGARGLGLDALQVGGALAGGGITPAGQALGLLGSVAGGAAGGAVVGGPAGAVVGGALGGFQSALGIANTGASLDLQQAQLNDPGVGATARDIEQQRISGERDPSSTLGRVARSLPGAGAIGAIGGPLGAAMVSRLGGAEDPDVRAEGRRQAESPQMRAEARLNGMLSQMSARGIEVDEEQRERIGQNLLRQEEGAERGRRFAAEWKATRSDRTGTVE